MDVKSSEPHLSQLLSTIKCSTCGEPVEFRMLGEHICRAAPAVPDIPVIYQNSNKAMPPSNAHKQDTDEPIMPASIKKNNSPSKPTLSPLSFGNENPYQSSNSYGRQPPPPRSPSSPYYNNSTSPTDSGYSSTYTNNFSNATSKPLEPTRSATGTSASFMQKYNKMAQKNMDSTNQPSRLPSNSTNNNSRNDYFNNGYPDSRQQNFDRYQNNNDNGVYSTSPDQFESRTMNLVAKSREQHAQERAQNPYGYEKGRDPYAQENFRDPYRQDNLRGRQPQRKPTGPTGDMSYDRGTSPLEDRSRYNTGDPYGISKVKTQQSIESHDKYPNTTNNHVHSRDDRYNQISNPHNPQNTNGFYSNDPRDVNIRREREEDRNRSRSPAPYNDRHDYGGRYAPPASNQPYEIRDEFPRKPSHDRQNSSQPLYDNVRSQPQKPSYEQNNLASPHTASPNSYLPPTSPEPNKSLHNGSRNGSFSSQHSDSPTRAGVKPDNFQGSKLQDGSREQFNGEFDDLIDDLLREMDSINVKPPKNSDYGNTNSSQLRKGSHERTPRQDTCGYCNLEVDSSQVWALGRAWHPEHLLCAHCGKPINPKVGLVEKNGKVYCPPDFAILFLPKCRSCGLPVEREAVSASDGKLEGKWHLKCFGCHTCHKPFPDKSFYVFDNAPYCKRHYHLLNNSLCNNCDEPIEGPCAQTIEGWRYHPSCFVCYVCRNPLTDTYYSFEKRQYCETHIREMQRRRKIQAEKRQTLFRNI